MKRPRTLRAFLAALLALSAGAAAAAFTAPGWAETPARSAIEFLSPSLRAEQTDVASNRGMLWVDQGAKLWREPAGKGQRTCQDCHGEAPTSMRGVAARYPVVDRHSGRVVNLEGRINACRQEHQAVPGWVYDSEPLLSLTAFIAFQSRGLPLSVSVDGAARKPFEAGRTLFETRQGQLDLACRQCHDDNVGRRLRGDVISSGLGVGYPAYRLEWQGLGSLHRRLKACQIGVRATEFEAGSPEYLALELYLAARGRGLPIETPGIRR